jgi:hypothetical protein
MTPTGVPVPAIQDREPFQHPFPFPAIQDQAEGTRVSKPSVAASALVLRPTRSVTGSGTARGDGLASRIELEPREPKRGLPPLRIQRGLWANDEVSGQESTP